MKLDIIASNRFRKDLTAFQKFFQRYQRYGQHKWY